MMRGLFFAIAATGVLAAVLLWGGADAPPTPEAEVTAIPEAERPPARPTPAKGLDPPKPAGAPAPPKPTPPIETVELPAPAPFLDADTGPSPDASGDVESEDASTGQEALVADYDPDRSAALIRRMLAVYEAVLE